MFAAFPGNMALASGVKDMDGAHTGSCHEAMTADVDVFPTSLATAHDHDAPMTAQAEQATQTQHSDCAHGCSDGGCASVAGCSSFVGLFSLTGFSPLLPDAREVIPFQLSPHPDACNAGIYHPPRQNA
ncbi:MAG: hypothetical protein LBB51_04095 [Zoogloeaceae bacterium]|nr:hypothetical protein [Zoogloeaceae bacterium]